MKAFFSSLLRWLDRIRSILVNSLFIIVILAYVVILIGMQPKVPEQSALILDPHGSIVEEMELPSPASLPFSGGISTSQTRVHDMTGAITAAADDERIRVLVLKLDQMGHASLPVLHELRRAIEHFRASGKPVIATGPNYSQSQYYLAATADTVFLHPMGYVGIEGFSIYRNYIRDALDRLHIHAKVFRAGTYKSAIEPLLRNDMSPADRESNKVLLTTLWSHYLDDIAAMRHVKAARLQTVLDDPARYLEQQHGNLANLAKAEGLVDQLADSATIEHTIASRMGSEQDDYAAIGFRDYLQATAKKQDSETDNIGIITASGMILDGEQPAGSIGSSSMQALLKQAEQDTSIKAVVLRIDSPGGSAQASEIIRSAVVRLKQSGKPVVVSMGGAAASGGYWMATPADQIWAEPTTITGSIGAFGVMLNGEKALEQLGVHSDGLSTTRIAGGLRMDRAMPEQLANVMQLTIADVYQRFLQIVAEGRKMDIQQVETIAEGRVWSGDDAKRLGLVDQLGGLDDAVKAAAKLASLGDHYHRFWIRPAQGFGDLLMARILGSAESLMPATAQQLRLLATAYTGLSAADLQHYSRWLGLPLNQPGALVLSDLRIEQ